MTKLLCGTLIFLTASLVNAQGTLVGGPCEGCEAIFEYGDRRLSPVDTLPGYEEADEKLKITGTVYKQDGKALAAKTFTPELIHIGTMSVERAAHQATLLETGEVLITGGCSGEGCGRILASAELYDPATRSFQSLTPMSTPRASHAAIALRDGRVLVSGGWTGSRAVSSAEVYDLETGRWSAVGEMAESRASHIAVPLSDGTVLIMGGGTGGLGNLTTVEIFDPANSMFKAAGRMHSNHYLGTPLADGRVLMTGGQDENGEIHGKATIFDPASGTFRETGSMAIPRVKHAGVPLADGNIMIIGGSDSRGYRNRFSSTEIFDPEKGTFSSGPKMSHGRHKIRDAVVLLPSGEVLVAGGAVQPELFDPRKSVFIPITDLLSGPQMFATATLLPGGEVLILGGYDERTRPSAAAWLVRTGQ